jgi:hypothetical protein
MNGTAHVGAVLQGRFGARLNQQQHNQASYQASSIELKIATNYSSIELPEEIKSLITGTDEWVEKKTNRYKRLVSQGYLQHLLYLAKMAREKQDVRNPSNWFANVC